MDKVSILIAARNSEDFIAKAIMSARHQTYENLEIVVIDDQSIDQTKSIALAHAKLDSRVRVFDGPATGLPQIRNMTLEKATGEFVAILDSDDILHPSHIESLVELQRQTNADIVANTMIEFQSDADGCITRNIFMDRSDWLPSVEISLSDYIRYNGIEKNVPAFGYLKPLIKKSVLLTNDIRYHDGINIGEDYHFVFDILKHGGRFIFSPVPTYFYRKHSASVSYRLSVSDCEALLAQTRINLNELKNDQASLHLRRREQLLKKSLDFEKILQSIKQKHVGNAALLSLQNPKLILSLASSFLEGRLKKLKRLSSKPGKPAKLILRAAGDDENLKYSVLEVTPSETGALLELCLTGQGLRHAQQACAIGNSFTLQSIVSDGSSEASDFLGYFFEHDLGDLLDEPDDMISA